MSGRPKRPSSSDHENAVSPELAKLIFVAAGIAMLIGLACGVVWTAYHLLKGYFGG